MKASVIRKFTLGAMCVGFLGMAAFASADDHDRRWEARRDRCADIRVELICRAPRADCRVIKVIEPIRDHRCDRDRIRCN